MKICSPQLGLSPESNSGGEVYDREVISRLCQKGVKIHTLLPKGRSFPQHKNLMVKHALIKPMTPPHVFSLFALPYIVKTYLTYKFDILRIHNPYFLGPAVLAFKKLFPQVPIVASFLHLEDGVNYFIAKSAIFNFDHIITISQSTKNELISNFNYPKAKISVSYPGVDNSFRPGDKNKELVKKLNLKNKTVLLFLGGLKKRKNPQFLLKLLKKLKTTQVVLIFAGTGPMLKELQVMTNNLGLSDKVRFTGFIPEKDKLDYYQLADVLLLPSLKEGFGMTITEAGACQIPAVGAGHYSIKEIIIDGQTGFLARSNDLNQWSQKLTQLIESKSLRQKMGQAAQKHVKSKFTWSKNINTHLKVFNQLLK